MVATLISIRTACPRDAAAIAHVHDAAWREAYRGISPGRELERLVARRGARWWEASLRRGSRISLLEFGETLVGYTSYGPSRSSSLPFKGEVYEIYLEPSYQGLGFGRRLFAAARTNLGEHGYGSALVWVLADNERAIGFYGRLGGRLVREAGERFAGEDRKRLAFGFD
jgi:ribosomal protein S18 acetylase RimI-like enzyme